MTHPARVLVMLIFLSTCATLHVRGQLTATPENVDMGRLKQNVEHEVTVQLTNTGPEPIEVLGASSDCGCTAAGLKTGTLEPGEQTPLRVAIQTRDYQGLVRRNVRVQTSVGEITIPIKLTVAAYEHWLVNPSTAVMPRSSAGADAKVSANLQHTGSREVAIKGITCEPSWLDAEISTQKEKAFTVTLTKHPDTPSGMHTVNVSVQTTDPVEPKVSFNVVLTDPAPPPEPAVTRHRAIRVFPSSISILDAVVGQRSSREFTVQGWHSPAPRVEVQRAHAALLRRNADEWVYELSLTPTRPGRSTLLMRVFQEEKLALEIPIVLRAEAARAEK